MNSGREMVFSAGEPLGKETQRMTDKLFVPSPENRQ